MQKTNHKQFTQNIAKFSIPVTHHQAHPAAL